MSASHASDIATAKAGRNDSAPAPEASPETKQRLQALSSKAKERWAAGQWMDAIALVSEVARLDPFSPQAHRDLGVTYLYCGRFIEAAASLRRAIELQPDYEDAMIHLVEALDLQGREAELLEACRALRELAKDETDRLYYAARALAKRGASRRRSGRCNP